MAPNKGKPLTDQQRIALKVIREYFSENGYAPLYREIQEGATLSNVGLVYKNLEALEKKGYIEREKNTKRGIELTTIGEEADLGASEDQLEMF